MLDGCSSRLTPKHRKPKGEGGGEHSRCWSRRLPGVANWPVFHVSLWAVEFGRLSSHKGKQDNILTYSDHLTLISVC